MKTIYASILLGFIGGFVVGVVPGPFWGYLAFTLAVGLGGRCFGD